jgi:hypothetical protein
MMLAAALLLPGLLSDGAVPPPNAVTLTAPRVEYRANEASATRSPWIDANGWRIQRDSHRTFVYHASGEVAALAAAESFAYGAGALIATDPPGVSAFNHMIEFLRTIPATDLNPVADFGVVDDGSDPTGELLNLLTRMNLLYKTGKNPDRNLRLNVQLGTKEYPREEAANPSLMAHKIRSQLGDAERSLRIYGSELVIGRILGGPKQMRVFLVNYSARPILGLRVRVKGAFPRGELRAFGVVEAHLADWTQDGAATEFTVPELRSLAVIDLTRD